MLNKLPLSAMMLAFSASLLGCNQDSSNVTAKPTVSNEDAKQFVEKAQQELEKVRFPSAQADWVYQTHINQDTAALSAYLSEII